MKFNKKKYIKEYQQKHKEHLRKYNKKYRKENKDKLKKQRKRYYFRNKDLILTKQREYYKKNKDKINKNRKEYEREYYKKHKEKNKEQKKNYKKEYNQRLETKKKVNENLKKRRKEDTNFRLKVNLRSRAYIALNLYLTTGKIMKSKDYGINYKKIIEHLKPFPKDIENYEVDHIIPLCKFDFNNKEQVRRAFAPENHKWLLAEKNREKNDKLKHPGFYKDERN